MVEYEEIDEAFPISTVETQLTFNVLMATLIRLLPFRQTPALTTPNDPSPSSRPSSTFDSSIKPPDVD